MPELPPGSQVAGIKRLASRLPANGHRIAATNMPENPRKLRASPNYSLQFAASGAAYLAGEVEPYHQFWVSGRERILFALFGRKGGLAVPDGIAAVLAMSGAANSERERGKLERLVADMEAAGVLIDPAEELSRYDRTMARDYLNFRPFPSALADRIAELGGRGRVLDLAAGPGSLALELAARGADVTIMELSRGFVAAAEAEARSRGLGLKAIHESCNRLVQLDEEFDAITISQAIHWLDDVALCKGVARCLAAGGSFFVVHGALSLPARHPLAYLLGDKTPLGDKRPGHFHEEVRPLYRRLSLLLEALDAPDVVRHDPFHPVPGRTRIEGERVELYRQIRPIGEGFARAFLSDSHIASLGVERDAFWADLQARCAVASEEELLGTQKWALLQFRRGARGIDVTRHDIGEEMAIAFP